MFAEPEKENFPPGGTLALILRALLPCPSVRTHQAANNTKEMVNLRGQKTKYFVSMKVVKAGDHLKTHVQGVAGPSH